LRDGGEVGEEGISGEGQKVEKIHSEGVQPVSTVRTAKGVLSKIQYVSNMPEKIRLEGRNPRGNQIKLVTERSKVRRERGSICP
jgi:hypothetical protein